MNSFIKYVCRTGDRLKPILTKFLPKPLLKRIKHALIKSADSKERLPFDKMSNIYPFGVNLVGYIKAQMGLGQGCRLIAGALEAVGLPYVAIDTRVGNPFNHDDCTFESKLTHKPVYMFNIFHMNPEQMPYLKLELPDNMQEKRYNIGIWLWELPDFPDKWCEAFRDVDEVWAPSNFTCDSIRKKAPNGLPVTLIPYGVEAPCDSTLTRNDFGLPENRFMFLSLYDTNSTAVRKNPIGAIHAFQKAFPKGSGDYDKVGLCVKVNNPTKEDMLSLSEQLDGFSNIFIFTETLKKNAVNRLIQLCNGFISLHRAEGFGLVIAEAMLLGTPVIATHWSANVDFMNSHNSCCVKYTLKQIGTDSAYFYESYQTWAEPDEDDAARYCRELFYNADYRNSLVIEGRRTMVTGFSPAASGRAIEDRLYEIIQ